jgi:glycosyltransferase involved in cell wall biosynthesis
VTGALDQAGVADLFGRASIFVSPARYEPFGLAPLEAALAGCALVLSRLESLQEVWGGSATYVPPDDPSALASALAAAWRGTQPGREPEREERARADAARRLESYGGSFTALMYEVAARGSR